MGYRRMTIDDLISIHRRWRDSQTISDISRLEGFDRKTVREYVRKFEEAGMSLEGDAQERSELTMLLSSFLPSNERAQAIQDGFRRYQDEIISLITDDKEPVKPKTAYKIITRKYEVPGSYESFKVFVRKMNIAGQGKPSVPRIELPPGKEIQVDYCGVGYHIDPQSGKNRKVNGFIGKLSCSRQPFVEFTYTQKQESFVYSNVHMVEFFNGVTEYITIDNLKSGVLKPDVYDPKLNRAYAEFAEYYGTFINTCMVGHSKGKAKVERLVQQVRELYRELKAVHPSYTLKELNREALTWCREEYGRAKHGTTGRAPMIAFEEEEKARLKPLPAVRFEVPRWKQVKVHPDQFFTFDGKRYAMPKNYCGWKLRCRESGAVLREYITTSRRVKWLPGDFPESQEAMMRGSYPQYLIARARSFGPGTVQLIESILRPHAFIKARAARGVLALLEDYRDLPFLQEVCVEACKKGMFVPKQIKYFLESEKKQRHFEFVIPRSPVGEAMIRDVREYIN